MQSIKELFKCNKVSTRLLQRKVNKRKNKIHVLNYISNLYLCIDYEYPIHIHIQQIFNLTEFTDLCVQCCTKIILTAYSCDKNTLLNNIYEVHII